MVRVIFHELGEGARFAAAHSVDGVGHQLPLALAIGGGYKGEVVGAPSGQAAPSEEVVAKGLRLERPDPRPHTLPDEFRNGPLHFAPGTLVARTLRLPQIVSRTGHQDTRDLFAEEVAEVFAVAGNQVRGVRCDRSSQDRQVFLR